MLKNSASRFSRLRGHSNPGPIIYQQFSNTLLALILATGAKTVDEGAAVKPFSLLEKAMFCF